jgi:hypothetical protein
MAIDREKTYTESDIRIALEIILTIIKRHVSETTLKEIRNDLELLHVVKLTALSEILTSGQQT